MQTFNEILTNYLLEDKGILSDYTFSSFLEESYKISKDRRKIKRLHNKTKIIINPNINDITKQRKK